MNKAAFSITDYRFDQVHIDLSSDINDELYIDFSPEGIYHFDKNMFQLIFEVAIKDSEENKPFIKIRCNGFFKFREVNSLEEVPDFFFNNSIAILFPYVRAYVSLVTSQANIRGIILPTLNLSPLGEKLKTNTIQK